MSMCVVAHGVGDFDGWLGDFKLTCEGKDEGKFHTQVIKAKYHLAGKLMEKRDGKDACLVFCAHPKSTDDAVKQALKFDSPPFVGGPDLRKKGAVILPADPSVQASLVSDRPLAGAIPADEELIFFAATHAVSSFEEWYNDAFNPVPQGSL